FNSYDFLRDGCEEDLDFEAGVGCLYAKFEGEIELAKNTDELLGLHPINPNFLIAKSVFELRGGFFRLTNRKSGCFCESMVNWLPISVKIKVLVY
ncbi:MAG: hypothetical protein ACPHO8_08425, partial [Mariniblastus sp.]